MSAEKVGKEIVVAVLGAVRPPLVLEPGPRLSVLAVEFAFRLFWPLCTARIDFAGVEPWALFLVANNVVGGSNFLEARFRAFVAGV